MKRLLVLTSLGFVCLALPTAAHAQRGRNFTPVTPFGQAYDPTLWKQSNGNMVVYQQLFEQKMMVAQQKAMQQEYQAMVKQQQAREKWLKEQAAKKSKGQPVDPAYSQLLAQQAEYQKAQEARAAKIAAAKAKRDATKARVKKAIKEKEEKLKAAREDAPKS